MLSRFAFSLAALLLAGSLAQAQLGGGGSSGSGSASGSGAPGAAGSSGASSVPGSSVPAAGANTSGVTARPGASSPSVSDPTSAPGASIPSPPGNPPALISPAAPSGRSDPVQGLTDQRLQGPSTSGTVNAPGSRTARDDRLQRDPAETSCFPGARGQEMPGGREHGRSHRPVGARK